MEAPSRRTRSRKAQDLILPGSEPIPMHHESDHGPLWDQVNALRERMARVEYAQYVALALLLAIIGKLLFG